MFQCTDESMYIIILQFPISLQSFIEIVAQRLAVLSLVTLQLNENSTASRRRESILVGLPTFLCRKFPTKEYRKSLGAVCSRSYDQKFVIIQEYATCLDTRILLERVYLVRGILLEQENNRGIRHLHLQFSQHQIFIF